VEIAGIIWLRSVVDKLAEKHHVEPSEVESVLDSSARFRRVAKGNVDGEDVYAAVGQTHSGRYLIVFFIYKATREALVISARDATTQEQRCYGRK
jgi:uncharacterized protein